MGEPHMKKILGIKLFGLIVMLLVLLSSTQAAMIVNVVSDEFSLESPYPVDNLKACQCSTRTDVLEINNIGDFKALFKVEIFSPTKDLITLSEDTFTLSPKDEKKVYVHIKAPCDAPLNTFYVARVSTDYGRSKEIYKEVVSKQCQNIKFISQVLNEGAILPGETTTIKIDLQNVADFQDTFRIMPEAYDDFSVISEKEVTLAPDEQRTIYAYISLPLFTYGKISYPFTISSDNGKNSLRGLESFTIEKDYDYIMSAQEPEINVCEDVTKEVPIKFTNLAKTPNKYYLYLTAPEFAKLNQNVISLDAEQEGSVNIVINPALKDVGTYNLILSAGTEYGDTYKDKSFKLNVNHCFDSGATLESQSALISEKACCGQKIYTLNIRNNGMYEEAYEITVDSPGWASVKEEDKFVRIKPSQNINIPVTIDFPCVDAKQTSFVVVKQLRAPFQVHEMKLDLESLSQRTCYNIELLQDKYRINYDTKSIPMLLKSTGMRGGTYKLELGELDSRFVYLDQETIEFNPGDIKVLHVLPRDYSAYKQGTYLNKLTLTVSLVDQETGIKYDRQFWVVLKDKNFISKAIDYIRNFNYSRIGWCGVVTIILALLVLALIIIVAYLRLKKDYKMKRVKASCMKKIKVVNIVLIFLLIISILTLVLIGNPNTSKFYEESQKPVMNSSLYHEWKQNTPYQLDLKKYYTDPDFDMLRFASSQPNHINVKIEGGMVTLTPEHNWAGEEKIVFVANDDKGGVTDSPIMTLKVLKKQPIGPMAYWNTYCQHINIVLFIIIILLVLLWFDVIEEKGYNYYNPRKNSR
jgi:hypothetical protein